MPDTDFATDSEPVADSQSFLARIAPSGWPVGWAGPLLASAGLLALGMVVGGYLLGDGLRRSREADRAVTVRGLAEREVTADLATWTIAYSATAEDMGSAQASIDHDS